MYNFIYYSPNTFLSLYVIALDALVLLTYSSILPLTNYYLSELAINYLFNYNIFCKNNINFNSGFFMNKNSLNQVKSMVKAINLIYLWYGSPLRIYRRTVATFSHAFSILLCHNIILYYLKKNSGTVILN